MPATSSNVTRTWPASTGLAALDLPRPPSPPPPPIMLAPRRMIQIHSPASSSTGSRDSSRLRKKPRPELSGSALISTPGRLQLLGELVGVGEGRDLGTELRIGLVVTGRIGGGDLQLALDGQAGGVDLLDVLGVHLLGELGVGDRLHRRAVEEGRDEEEGGVDGQQREAEPPPVDLGSASRGAGQPFGAPRRLGLLAVGHLRRSSTFHLILPCSPRCRANPGHAPRR